MSERGVRFGLAEMEKVLSWKEDLHGSVEALIFVTKEMMLRSVGPQREFVHQGTLGVMYSQCRECLNRFEREEVESVIKYEDYSGVIDTVEYATVVGVIMDGVLSAEISRPLVYIQFYKEYPHLSIYCMKYALERVLMRFNRTGELLGFYKLLHVVDIPEEIKEACHYIAKHLWDLPSEDYSDRVQEVLEYYKVV